MRLVSEAPPGRACDFTTDSPSCRGRETSAKVVSFVAGSYCGWPALAVVSCCAGAGSPARRGHRHRPRFSPDAEGSAAARRRISGRRFRLFLSSSASIDFGERQRRAACVLEVGGGAGGGLGPRLVLLAVAHAVEPFARPGPFLAHPLDLGEHRIDQSFAVSSAMCCRPASVMA